MIRLSGFNSRGTDKESFLRPTFLPSARYTCCTSIALPTRHAEKELDVETGDRLCQNRIAPRIFF